MRRNGPSRRILLAGGLMSSFAGCAPASAEAGALVEFTRDDGGSDLFDHDLFDALLAAYARSSADGVVRVDYRRWAEAAADRVRLERYISGLAAADPLRLSRNEQFAFWANLYNALTLRLVLEAFPVRSILKIRPVFFAIGPWKKKLVRVRGLDLSLDDIETGVLRTGWRDPRVHYALNCASIGCPNLPLTAWRGTDLAERLDAAAKAYVNHPRGVRFEADRLVVSSIYKWYAADFGGSDAHVIAHLRKWAAPALSARLNGAAKIGRTSYDWSLNAVPA